MLDAPHPLLIGVVHLRPTPGSPGFPGAEGSVGELLELAANDARALAEGGADAVIVENFGDVPFFAGAVPPETVATLALALGEVRRAAPGLPLGVNVLRNDARAAVGLCAASGASFLRVNVHSGAAVTDQGVISGDAATTLRERARLCPEALVLADVLVKHAAPLGESDIGVVARDTFHRGLADGLIVSGTGTGEAPVLADLERVREAVPTAPVLVGSGLDASNAAALARVATGAICGTALKEGGVTRNAVDPARVARLRELFR